MRERHGRDASALLPVIAPRDRAVARADGQPVRAGVQNQQVTVAIVGSRSGRLDERRPREDVIHVPGVVLGQIALPTPLATPPPPPPRQNRPGFFAAHPSPWGPRARRSPKSPSAPCRWPHATPRAARFP